MHYNTLIQDHLRGLRGDDQAEGSDLRPFHSVDKNDEQKVLKWLVDTMQLLCSGNESRAAGQLRNINFYGGIHALDNNESVRAVDYDKQPISMENRFVMNHILEFTLHKQARLTRFSPTINVFPWNNEYKDRLGAKLGKKIVDSGFYTTGFDAHLGNISLESAICGESFLLFLWNKLGGEKRKEVETAKIREKAGYTFKTADGEEIKLDRVARIGDHRVWHPLPWQVLHEPRVRYCDVNYHFVCDFKHIDDIKAENASLGSKELELIKNASTADKSTLPGKEVFDYGNYVVEWKFFHKKSDFVPDGFQAVFYNDVLVSYGPLEYEEYPIARFTDYDDPTNAHGRSFYESLKLPSVMINNMMKVAYRSFVIAAYPKLIMEADSYNMYSMANGPFVIEYNKGATPPQIASFSAVNRDFFPLTQHVENFMEKNSGTHGISRGEAMPNARAASILNFYEEQEQERESTQIAKRNAFVEKGAKNVMRNFVQFTDPKDERTIQVIGKNNQYKVQKIGPEEYKTLTSDKIVKVQRTTALSESKQGRIDQVTALSSMPIAGEQGAGLFTREQILQLVELADTETFFDLATAAAERALGMAEDLYAGNDVPPPEEHMALLVDWNVFFQFMQSAEFYDTKGVPPEVKTKFLNHVRTIEAFLYEKCKKNLALAMALGTNKYFPSVFKTDPVTDLPISQIILLLQSTPPPPPMAPPAMPTETVPENVGPSESVVEDAPMEPDLAVNEPLADNMQEDPTGEIQ